MVALEKDVCRGDEAGVDEEGEMRLCVEWPGRVNEVVGEDPGRVLGIVQVAQLLLFVDWWSDALMCGIALLSIHFCFRVCICGCGWYVESGKWKVESGK
jgi:hypothetical protein